MKKIPLFIIVLFNLFANTIWADELHYNNIIIGDRASGLGGAYTAISDDPSGLYHNPAGIVYSGRRNLSASVNAFNNSTTTYKDVFGKGKDYVRSSSVLLPNFFGITQPLGPGTFGFSYAVTNSINENQDSEFAEPIANVDSFNLNINNTDVSYKVGPSYAYEVNDSFSIGATLYAHIRTVERIVNQFIDLNQDQYEWSNSYDQLSEFGINPILGIMWSPYDRLSIGLSLRQTTVINTTLDSQVSCASNISPVSDPNATDARVQPNPQCQPLLSDANNATSFIAGTVRSPSKGINNSNRQLPLQANIGFAYFYSPSLLISTDIAYFDATNTAQSVVNAAIGMEYYMSNDWAIRGGLYTNNTSATKINYSKTDQNDYINLNGISLSMSRFTRNSSITAGIGLSYGSGEAQILSGINTTQELNIFSTLLYLSSSYTY